MPLRYDLNLKRVKEPIRELVTKFGGQPVWRDQPVWPLDEDDQPMHFIGQVKLTEELFPGIDGRMAYLFFSMEHTGLAVVLQPGHFDGLSTRQANGPSIGHVQTALQHFLDLRLFRKKGEPPANNEWEVEAIAGEDPEWVDIDEVMKWPEDERQAYFGPMSNGLKLGGTPSWIQCEEWPDDDCDEWLFLCQIHSDRPFPVTWGDCGTLYAFIHRSGEYGIMTMQSY